MHDDFRVAEIIGLIVIIRRDFISLHGKALRKVNRGSIREERKIVRIAAPVAVVIGSKRMA